MMPALRCPTCLISWPNTAAEYGLCPACKSKTDFFSNVRPDMSDAEAVSMKNHFEADQHYASNHVPDLRLTMDELTRFTLENWKAEVARDEKARKERVRRAESYHPEPRRGPPAASA